MDDANSEWPVLQHFRLMGHAQARSDGPISYTDDIPDVNTTLLDYAESVLRNLLRHSIFDAFHADLTTTEIENKLIEGYRDAYTDAIIHEHLNLNPEGPTP